MPCSECRDNLNGNGHCYTSGCTNRQPENKAPMRAPKKRTALKPISDKQRKLYRDTKPTRHGPIKNGQVCDCCQEEPAIDPHEITAGSHRRAAMKDVRALMWLCFKCHKKLQGLPYEEQIAVVVKSVIAAVNRCCGRDAVCVEDVINQLKSKRKESNASSDTEEKREDPN